MPRPFNNHDLVSFNGHTYSVRLVIWSSDQHCYTLGLVGFDLDTPLIFVSSKSVKKLSKRRS